MRQRRGGERRTTCSGDASRTTTFEIVPPASRDETRVGGRGRQAQQYGGRRPSGDARECWTERDATAHSVTQYPVA